MRVRHLGWALLAAALPILPGPPPSAAAPPQDAPAPATPEGKPAAPPAVADLAAVLEPIRARHDLPALAAATIRDGVVAGLGACGVRARGKPEKAGVDDLWHLGSCTKAMTATLCAMLVEEGKLSFEGTLVGGLGDLAAKADPGWKGATLEMLLRNRGGASSSVPPAIWSAAWAAGDRPGARSALVRGFLALPPARVPGSAFEYSNMNFVLAGAMAEAAAGKDWETLIRERLFRPLGMEGAGFGAPGTAGAVDQPRGHRADGTAVPPGPGADNPPAIGPAGTVHASLRDWAKFLVLHLEGEGEKARLLRSGTFRRLHAPPEGEREGYAMGWGVARRAWSKGPVLTHAGSNTMWYCVTWLAPAEGRGVLVCTNAGGEAAAKAADQAASALLR